MRVLSVNVAVEGLSEDSVHVGDRLRIGTADVRVTYAHDKGNVNLLRKVVGAKVLAGSWQVSVRRLAKLERGQEGVS